MEWPNTHTTFSMGNRVRKTKGSQWKGKVVGWYSTQLTKEGYAVESDTEIGSVQIYPVSALVAIETSCSEPCNRFVWVFEVESGKYIMTEYNTESPLVARHAATQEYGYLIRELVRRELTFEEYCALLRCNHNQKVYQAMLRIVFTGSLSLV